MKLVITFIILFLTHCLSPTTISATVNAHIVALNPTPHSKKTEDRRVEKGKKLKGIAGYLFGFAFLLFVIGAGIAQRSPFNPVGIILAILAFACFAISLILFLIGLVMQHYRN
jgi:quinol-cytochrome oxidoreductase complex cytochrome b subunit